MRYPKWSVKTYPIYLRGETIWIGLSLYCNSARNGMYGYKWEYKTTDKLAVQARLS